MSICTIFLLIIELLILVILSISINIQWKKIYKIMSRLIKEMFMGLLINTVNASNQTKCVLLSNQKCDIQLTFIKFTS